ncbi:MAG: transglycosylase SLT domain-containing protein [Formosimonas sp.]
MFKIFQSRLLAPSLVALLISACAGNPVNVPQQPTPVKRSDSSYNQPIVQAQSNDIWQRIRNGYAMPDLYNAEVTSKENYYAQRADYVGRMASRSGDFMYLIMNEVERRKMPSEIALLPFVESAFVTTAQSPVKAAGLWQFMPATGRDFSLQQNHFADQRNDVVASTDAALTFLQRLHDQFGDWHLALAAYNWGPGNVNKAVRRAQASGLAGTYEDIKMPAETRQYVPKLQAIKNIVTNPAQFGIALPDVSNNLRHEVVTVTRDMDVATAAQLSGLDVESFKRINPAYKKTVIAASLGAKILVPANRADDVRRALRDTSQNLSSVTTYTTYNLESLDDIANKFSTNSDNLRYLNNIPSYHNFVKAGSALLVPRTSSSSSQDIPFGALTAGLSTTSGGIGLNSGDIIERPTLVVANTDETTREERSGIINPNINTLNDPLPAAPSFSVRNTPSAAAPEPIQVNNLTVSNAASTPWIVPPTLAPIEPSNPPVARVNPPEPAAPTPSVATAPEPIAVAATPPVTPPTTAPVVTPIAAPAAPVLVARDETPDFLKPIVPIVEAPEVVQPLANKVALNKKTAPVVAPKPQNIKTPVVASKVVKVSATPVVTPKGKPLSKPIAAAKPAAQKFVQVLEKPASKKSTQEPLKPNNKTVPKQANKPAQKPVSPTASKPEPKKVAQPTRKPEPKKGVAATQEAVKQANKPVPKVAADPKKAMVTLNNKKTVKK